MNYQVGLISIIVTIIYGLTLKLPNHRKIWNWILLINFLISAILGTIMATGIKLTGYQTILWIHVEAGVIMTVISVFHIWKNRKSLTKF